MQILKIFLLIWKILRDDITWHMHFLPICVCVCVCVCIHTYIVKATHLEIIAADECSTLLILTAEYYLITLFIHFLRFIFCLRWIGQEECSCKEFIVKISEPEDKSYMQLCAWHQGFSWIWHQIPQVIRLTVWSTV